MTKLQEMYAKLGVLKNEAEDLINKEGVTAEEIDAKTSEIKDLKAKIEAQKIVDEEEGTIENKGTNPITKPNLGEEPKNFDTQEELRAILTKDNKILNAMETKIDEKGGYVVSESLAKEIIQEITNRSSVYQFFNSTNVAGNLKLPKETGKGVAEWLPEGTASSKTDNDPSLDLVEFEQHRLYRDSAITRQMINAQGLDLVGYLKGDIADSMETAIEKAIFYGTGTDQPSGLITNLATARKVSLATRGVVTLEALKKAKYKINQKEWGTVKWFMHPDTMLEIDLLKDANGRPLLQQDPVDATLFRVLGIPVELTDVMDTTATVGAKCLALLATPKAYHTNTQPRNMTLYVYNDSAYTKKGMVGYGADIYLDGKTKRAASAVGIFNKA